MKTLFSILCGLLLLWAQAASAAVSACAHGDVDDCGCGGKMPCCQQTCGDPSTPIDAAPTVAAPQIFAPALLAVTFLLPPAQPAVITPTNFSALLSADALPLFARHCVWLI